MSITNTHKHTLERLQRRYGGYVGVHMRKRSDRERQAWRWYVTGPRAAGIIESVLPYLREKQPQAQLVLDYRACARLDPRKQLIKDALTSLKRPDFEDQCASTASS